MHPLIDHAGIRIAAFVAGALVALPLEVSGLLTNGAKLALAAMLLTYGLMPAVIRLAHRLGALDHPDARRVHGSPTPRIGGLALIVAVNMTLFLNFDYSIELKGVCISALIVALLSFWDDLRGLSALVKLAVQMLALVVLVYCDVYVTVAPDGWWGMLLNYLITALWIIGITNAFNFLDGINGLAASLAAAVCTLMALLAWHTGQTYMLLICLSIAGAAIGFLPDNARFSQAARTFLGDVGSTWLGWMMAAVAVMGHWSEEGPWFAYSAPLLIFSVMIFDMIHTTVARIARGDVRNFRQWVEFVGRDHLHHRLMTLGCSPRQAVFAVVGMTLITGFAALALVKGSIFTVALLLAQAVIFFAFITFLMHWQGRER